MKITIKSIHIENFKGIKMLDVTFSGKTKISGQNAVGKTTIFDAFTWLLFNKNSSGEEKFNVRPLNEGIRVDNVEIKVSAILDVDGKEVELSKTQKQNWVKKRGTDTAVLQGNVNSFEIDGYPKSEADFKAYVSELAQSEEMFKMLTNPQYFSSLKWKDQRDILMKLVSEVSDVELAQTDAKYAPLLSELEKAPSTDDIRAKFSKALNEWKKKQAEIPVRIDEAMKSICRSAFFFVSSSIRFFFANPYALISSKLDSFWVIKSLFESFSFRFASALAFVFLSSKSAFNCSILSAGNF